MLKWISRSGRESTPLISSLKDTKTLLKRIQATFHKSQKVKIYINFGQTSKNKNF